MVLNIILLNWKAEAELSLIDLVDNATLQQLLEIVVEQVQEFRPLLEGECG